ncbi:prosaposin-like isoform X3 [Salvelinus sp. IW2-2015]|uniref:prosaposin-like isoform X3 n=1 Tax=Salvelinus sp. IW2-2015 TaxID=2691554 RepID=UPI000CDFA55A|nr:prosaposin-like isoform X3 [Salvelinus alpinus]
MAVLQFIVSIFIAYFCIGETMVIREPTRAKLDITQQSSTSDICSDCSQIIELFTDMISNTDTQELINSTLDDLCQRLPGGVAQSHCVSQVQMYLPQALQYLIGILKPGETCMVLGLCAVHSKRGAPKQLSPTITDMDLSNAVLDSGTNPEVQVSPQCTFCVYLMKKLESVLPTDKIEDAIVKLMGGVCGLLPASYKDQCNDFINKYGKKIVNFLLPSAAPYSICALLHLFQETPSMEMLLSSDCDSCRTMAVLSRFHLGLNATESQTSSFLQSVCLKHPNTIPKCEMFTKLYGPRLQKVLGSQMDACERADVCVVVKEQHLLRKNHCTWGPIYICRDVKTSHECGMVDFCQKVMRN